MRILIQSLSNTKGKKLETVTFAHMKARTAEIEIADIVAVTDSWRAAILKNRNGQTGIVSLAEFQKMTAA